MSQKPSLATSVKKSKKKGVFGGFRKLSLMFSSGTVSKRTASNFEAPRRGSVAAEAEHESSRNRRVIFLGTGDSGKTALAHQFLLRLQPNSKIDSPAQILRTRIIHSTVSEAIEVLSRLLKDDPMNSTLLDLKNKAKEQRRLNGCKNFEDFVNLVVDVVSLEQFDSTMSGEYLNARQPRPRRLKIVGSKLRNLSDSDRKAWVPDLETILLCMNSTNGITSTPATNTEGKLEVLDAGGHMSERAKWDNLWENLETCDLDDDANVLVYTVSAADINANMFETKDRVRFDDSLKQFRKLMNKASFENSPLRKVFLVFTKSDLIPEMLDDPRVREFLTEKGFDFSGDDIVGEYKSWLEQQYLVEAESLLSLKGTRFLSSSFVNVFNVASVEELSNEIQNELL